jgi:hypothetical protein
MYIGIQFYSYMPNSIGLLTLDSKMNGEEAAQSV